MGENDEGRAMAIAIVSDLGYRVVRLDLKRLVTSGYANDVRTTGVAVDIPRPQKLYHRAELANQIRVALGHN
jgi:hypothetical protein